ncbi:MAG: four helix bundle protein [Vicinamibacteria bacterium]
MAINSFRDLEVWQHGMDLVVLVHEVTRRLPSAEFDLRRQIRRAAVSIPANVAEGWRRRSRPAYRYHVSIALGSQAELDTEIEIARRIGCLSVPDCQRVSALVARVGQMLSRLHVELREPHPRAVR